jgi:hypothetical protein
MAEDITEGKQKKGIIMWAGDGCQTCFAVLDLSSDFTLPTTKTITAELSVRKQGDHHILKIMEKK